MAEELRELLRHDLDWKYLLATADRHCLIPLLYLHLNAAAPSLAPPHVMERLRRDNHENSRSNLFLTGELLKVVELLEENGVRAVSFKGPTLALRVYGDVGLRQFGDLDILVQRKDILKVKELLVSLGFKSTLELTSTQQAALLRFDCAYNFENRQGVMLDVHWNFVEQHFSIEMNADRLWDRVEPITIGDMQFMTQHVTYHGRTPYKDDAAAGASRVLLRIWLSTPFSRLLPEGHKVQWGDTRPGALRGGALVGRSAIA